MRIISGLFKGKKILEPTDNKTRPLKDLTKESIFNIIKHSNKFEIDLINAYILDLFSGVGSFGLECLSRGVKKVVFIENYDEVLSVLKKNLSNLKSTQNYKIFTSNVYSEVTFNNLKDKFDVIFLDPPYKDKKINTLFENIKNYKILNKNGIIIIHRHKKEKDIFPTGFSVVEEKIYGISKIIILSLN